MVCFVVFTLRWCLCQSSVMWSTLSTDSVRPDSLSVKHPSYLCPTQTPCIPPPPPVTHSALLFFGVSPCLSVSFHPSYVQFFISGSISVTVLWRPVFLPSCLPLPAVNLPSLLFHSSSWRQHVYLWSLLDHRLTTKCAFMHAREVIY